MIHICHSKISSIVPQRLNQKFSHLLKSSTLTSTTRKMILTATRQDSHDPNTLSNYNDFLTLHTAANLSIDFQKQVLGGNVLLKLKAVNKAERQSVILDTSYVDIQDVKVDGISSTWKLLSRTEPYGSALEIGLEKVILESQTVDISVSSYDLFFEKVNADP